MVTLLLLDYNQLAKVSRSADGRRELQDDITRDPKQDTHNGAGRQHSKELVSGLFEL